MKVLAVGAHPDDIEIGCGGAIAGHHRAGDEIIFVILTQGQKRARPAVRRAEARAAAELLGAELIFGNYVDGELNDRQVNDFLEPLVQSFRPDVLYVHAGSDSHADHRAVSAGTLAAGRYVPTILQYESPSAIGFRPAIYVDITATLPHKIHALRCHQSQLENGSRVDVDIVEAKARSNGFDARVTYAEGFTSPRALWNPATMAQQAALPAQPRTLLAI